MYIMTKDGRVVEGELLTDQQVFEIEQLPKIIGDYPYLYISEADKKWMAKYLSEKLEMRKRPEEEPEVASDPESVVEALDYPAPTPPEEFPGF